MCKIVVHPNLGVFEGKLGYDCIQIVAVAAHISHLKCDVRKAKEKFFWQCRKYKAIDTILHEYKLNIQ